jgi:hypothetical protein
MAVDITDYTTARAGRFRAEVVRPDNVRLFVRTFRPAIAECLALDPPPPPAVPRPECVERPLSTTPEAPPPPPARRRPRMTIVEMRGAADQGGPDIERMQRTADALMRSLPATLRGAERCYGEALEADATLAGGVGLTLHVDEDGSLSIAGDHLEYHDATLANCVRQAVEEARVARRFAAIETSIVVALCPADRATCAAIVPSRGGLSAPASSACTWQLEERLRARADALETSMRAALRRRRSLAGVYTIDLRFDAEHHISSIGVPEPQARGAASLALLDALAPMTGICGAQCAPGAAATLALVLHAP